MEKILMLLALALSGAWAGIRLALKARAEAMGYDLAPLKVMAPLD